jgi:transcriptional regulator with XRE-family HTH domain
LKSVIEDQSAVRKKKLASPRSMNAIDECIAERLREHRLGANMSQDALGKASGVSFQQIQKYEKGVNRITASRLYEICKVLKVPLSSMFKGDPKA